MRGRHEIHSGSAAIGGGPDRATGLENSWSRDLFEGAPIPMHWVGPDGLILWANRAELELLGYEHDEYVGKPIAEFHVDPEEAHKLLQRLWRKEELRGHEARMRSKDGSIKHVLVSSNVVWHGERFVHTRCFTQDVTAHKLADEMRLAQSSRTDRLNQVTSAIADAVTPDQVFEALVDDVAAALSASSAGLFLVRSDPKVVQLARAVGYSDEGRSAFEVVRMDSADSFPALESIRSGEPIWMASRAEMVSRYPSLAGVTAGRSYSVACLPIRTRGGTLGSVAFTFDDGRVLDEEQRTFLLLVARYSGQALERLRMLDVEQESRVRAELLYGLVRSLTSACTLDEMFEAALDAIERALGTDRASILVFVAHGVMRFRAWRNLSDAYRSAVDGHSPWSRDVRDPQPIVCADTESDVGMEAYRPVFRNAGIRALGFIPLVSAGRLVGKFMVYYPSPRVLAPQELDLARAIADHVAAAIARCESITELQETVRFNELFTAILGHDLRNPLTAILTSAQQLMSQDNAGPAAKSLARIMRSGNRMARMIEQLLDVTRMRMRGGLPLARKDVDILLAIRQVIDELETANPGWSFGFEAIGDGRGHWDPDRLSQVFSNLVGNAVQHGLAEQGVQVRVDGRAMDHVRVEIMNGGAIPPAALARMFQPLVVGGESTVHPRGLGLGLFITQEIVRGHGGRITVDSGPSRGTRFAIELPRRPA
jgi:PAS domain S-box-containing protein